MNDFKQLKEQYKEKYRGFGRYAQCMTEGLLTGVASFALTFSALYFSQVLLRNRLPYQPKHFLIIPTIASSSVAWLTTARRARKCQEEWTYHEPYYTGFDKK